MFKSKKVIVLIILILFFLSISGESRAALQSNPNTYYTKTDTSNNWIVNFRNMETTGQAMGLTESINGTTLVPTSSSNGIDVHMMKTTEYGAIAILSASGYGNPQTIQSSGLRTTTGNKTGIYYALSTWEFSASALQGYPFASSMGVDLRYYSDYSNVMSSVKTGDALGNASAPKPGCYFWHSASNADWMPYDSRINYVHGYSSIFSYSYTYYWAGYYARGVAVCGTGL